MTQRPKKTQNTVHIIIKTNELKKDVNDGEPSLHPYPSISYFLLCFLGMIILSKPS